MSAPCQIKQMLKVLFLSLRWMAEALSIRGSSCPNFRGNVSRELSLSFTGLARAHLWLHCSVPVRVLVEIILVLITTLDEEHRKSILLRRTFASLPIFFGHVSAYSAYILLLFTVRCRGLKRQDSMEPSLRVLRLLRSMLFTNTSIRLQQQQWRTRIRPTSIPILYVLYAASIELSWLTQDRSVF